MVRTLQKTILSLFLVTFLGGAVNSQIITTFPYTQDFESFTTCGTGCGAACTLSSFWTNDTGDNIDWTTDIGGTSSSPTGPPVDHTLGTTSGTYLYVESSCSGTGFPNMTANLLSPQIDLSGTNQVMFEFWYHMYGSTMGSAHVDISNDGGLTWTLDIIPSWTDNIDLWQQQSVNLSAWTGQVVIVRIRHITGANYYSDMGIDDVLIYDLLPEDAGITAFINPVIPSCTFNDSVSVEITNYGTNTLTSATINWALNSVPQTPYSWTGSLASGATDTVFIGTAPYVNSDVLEAWTSLPNGVPEMPSGTGNDSLSITLSTGLAGTYVIGGALPDFIDFNSAVNALATYGVCGSVVFNVEDGIYNEQIILGEYIGIDSASTVTFQSLNADPALVSLTFAGTGVADNFVISMDGADFITFNNLTLANTGVTYGRVIEIQNGATNNTWSGNIIMGDMNVGSTSTNMALVYSGSGITSIDTSNTFDGNDFMYGSYAFYYYGGGTADLENGTVITNNTFTDFYYRGLNMYYQGNMEISGNTITPGANYTGAVYRMYLYYAGGALRVNNNIIGGDLYGYGIYMSNCNAWVTDPGYVYNNFFHVGNPATTSTSYGIYLLNCDNQMIKYNSVNMESLGTTSRAMYVSGGSQNHVKNNVFKNNGPGYGMYYVSGVGESNNNNIYAPNGTLFYSGGAISDLATWQATTAFDMMSDTLDPLFLSPTDLHTCQDVSLDGGAEPDTMVMYDIDGQLRDANTPDIGADEFLGLANLAFATDTMWKCSTGTVDLGGWEPTDDASYSWSTGESTPAITASNQGNYSVIVVTACGTTMPSVVVSNIPDAVADFSTTMSFMTAACTNDSYGTIDTYSWNFGDGFVTSEFEPTHLYSDTGVFIITLTVTGPCGTDVFTDTMYSTTVGVDENSITNSLTVYPNPNNGEFAVEFDLDQTAEVSISLMNPQGQIVWNSELGSVQGTQTETVNLSDTPAGIYFLTINVNGESSVRKIIVE